MPSVMVALPNIGGALCLTPQSLTDIRITNISHGLPPKWRKTADMKKLHHCHPMYMLMNGSSIAEGPRDALNQLKYCQLLHNCTKNRILKSLQQVND